ncbi:hypothetical protein [Streptomyces mirabilis]|uniref:hypothetical protein n=1 Tax=Streptomyces mirabilis TaxID=68239 RepID=UPI003D9DEEC3
MRGVGSSCGPDRTGLGGGRPVLRIADSDGLGLGLSIVAAVAMAHGGSVAAWPRAEGGLSVKVTLPPR